MLKLKQLFVAGALALATLGMASMPAQAGIFDSNRTAQLPDFTKLAEENTKVVVNISTTKHIKASVPPVFHGMPDDILRFFFGMPPGAIPGQPMPRQLPEEVVRSLGSGFIISSDGYILTNNHVVAGADEVVVKLYDRKEMKAKVVGTDPKTDVALLKIDATDLPYAKIGSAKNLKIGQWVLAIGEPFGLSYTVTHGIISALGRALPSDTYVPFIQTDVPINPGNSGGPLINMKGEVVGINAQIYSKSGGYMGLSFSIPIDIAMNVAEQIKENGHVVHGFLGVQVQEVNGELAKSFGMDKPQGALVAEVVKGSAADKAGLKPGDIIIEFDGHTVHRSTELPPIVGIAPVGKPLKMKILRQGKEKTLTVKLQPLPDEESLASAGENSNTGNFGAMVRELKPEELKALNLPFGVQIVSVVEGGAAQKAGILPGDILVTLNFQPVKSIPQLIRILKDAPKGRAIPVRVIRDGHSLFLPLVLGKK
ncbi:DegQ family serine endoprotease [Galenea microaerophila]